MTADRSAPIDGVMVALATPLDDQGRLSSAGLDRLLDHILHAPVTGLCPVGSTGEGPLLSRALRVDLTAAVAAKAPAGMAIMPATVSVNAHEAAEDLRAYSDAGATAALVTPPFYYPLDDNGVRRFYDEVAADTPLPLLLYNIPAMTKVPIPVPVVASLAAHPSIVGIKDSSRDLEYFQSVVSAVAESVPPGSFSVLTGSDTLLVASMVAGGSGTIAASVNLVPNLVTDLYRAIEDGQWEQARTLQSRLIGIVHACRRPGFPAGWKAALALAGLCGPQTASPISPATPDATARLRDDLTALHALPT